MPIPTALKRHLIRVHRTSGLVFGDETPFDYWRTVVRVKAAWKAAGLERMGLHEARHTYASLMIAAGVNAKALAISLPGMAHKLARSWREPRNQSRI